MIDMKNKIELCGEVFSKEEVWEAYCNVCEANTCFLLNISLKPPVLPVDTAKRASFSISPA